LKHAASSLVIGVALVGTVRPKARCVSTGGPNTQRGIPTLAYATLIDGDIDGAIQVFRQIEQPEPESPLGYVLEADSDWEADWQCFPSWETAFYFSTSSYTTVGYGDVVLSQWWRTLGPVESVVGVLMTGLSVSVLFSIMTRLVEREVGS
jgi:hypothetical protein